MKGIKYILLSLIIALTTPSVPAGSVDPDVPPDTIETSSKPTHITVMLGGDVLIWGGVARALDKDGTDAVISPALAKRFSDADIAMVNLEMAVGTRGVPMEEKQFTFRGKPEHLSLLKHMGIDVVSVANNHTLDYGREAFLDTLQHLNDNGIAPVGGGNNLDEASEFCTVDVQGRKVGILAASRVVPAVDWHAGMKTPGLLTTYDPSKLNAAIAKAKETCDFVLVYVHWGVEGETIPEEYQRKLAYGYIDAGADAVFGSHPHVLQGFEIYNGKPIAYSLGNFIFTSSRPDTCAVRLNLTDDEVWLDVLPCRITSPYVTLIEDETQISKQLRALERISYQVKIDADGRVRAA